MDKCCEERENDNHTEAKSPEVSASMRGIGGGFPYSARARKAEEGKKILIMRIVGHGSARKPEKH